MRPVSMSPNVAICLFDSVGSSSSTTVREKCSEIFNLNNKSYFEHFGEPDLYKNLWLASFQKRRVEIERNKEFDLCLAVSLDQEVDLNHLSIPEVIKDKIYFVRGKYIYENSSTGVSPKIFFAKSRIFDLACNFTVALGSLPLNRTGKTIEEDFYFFLKTVKIETECINYENSSLFERTASYN